MIEETEARERVLASVSPLPAEKVVLAKALGRWASGDTWATHSVPPHDNSAMDGYAIHAADCGQTSSLLRVIDEQPAGQALGLHVAPGTAVRIFTGAPLPAGTGAVVMQEDIVRHGTSITLTEAARVGEFIRRAGCDLAAGQKFCSAGQRWTATRLGLAASQGLQEVVAHRWPKIGILTTGSELQSAGQVLAPGQIYNSNQTLLASQLREEFPALEILTAHVVDDLQATQQALLQLCEQTDAVLIAGGVSVGDHDYVKPALVALGAELDFWRVRMKPGKPFLHGKLGSTAIFGLPGNPVSAYVTSFAFALPALRKMAGQPADRWFPAGLPVRLAQPLMNKDNRPTYFRGVYAPKTQEFSPQGLQESHALATLAQATMLVRVPAGTACEAGGTLLGWPIG